jgi:hypothetical protein
MSISKIFAHASRTGFDEVFVPSYYRSRDYEIPSQSSLMSLTMRALDKVPVFLLKYIPLTLYPRRGSRGISDILSRHPRFTKIS